MGPRQEIRIESINRLHVQSGVRDVQEPQIRRHVLENGHLVALGIPHLLVYTAIFTQLKIITTHRISLIKEKEHPSSRIHFRPFPTEMKAIFQGNKRALFWAFPSSKRKMEEFWLQ